MAMWNRVDRNWISAPSENNQIYSLTGVSAAFLVWDVIDLGFTVTDLVTKKGSKAGSILREKADQLEEALSETKGQYTLDMMPD